MSLAPGTSTGTGIGFTMQLVVLGMRERRSGTIVNITSIAGVFAAPIQGRCCASRVLPHLSFLGNPTSD